MADPKLRALELLYNMMKRLDKPEDIKKAQQVFDEVPLDTLLSYRASALDNAIKSAAQEDPGNRVPLAIIEPQTFLDLALPLSKNVPAANSRVLRAIREGREIKKYPTDISSEGIRYQDGLRQMSEPGWSDTHNLWFGQGELAVKGHEGRHRSTEMLRHDVPEALVRMHPHTDTPTLRQDLNDRLQNELAKVYAEKGNYAGRAGSLWKLLPAAAATTGVLNE
jgi:hypothetical protein